MVEDIFVKRRVTMPPLTVKYVAQNSIATKSQNKDAVMSKMFGKLIEFLKLLINIQMAESGSNVYM
jgi:hypothetical protein